LVWFGFGAKISRTRGSGESFYQNYCYRREVGLLCGSSAEEDRGGSGNQSEGRGSL